MRHASRPSPVQAQPSTGTLGSGGGQPTITETIFTNRQQFADRWLELEVQQKYQAEDPHRARPLEIKGRPNGTFTGLSMPFREQKGLLQLWAPELFEDSPQPEMQMLVSANWLWAALSKNPKAALAEMESIHHRAAAALVLGRLEEAVGLYLTNELLAEACRKRFATQSQEMDGVWQGLVPAGGRSGGPRARAGLVANRGQDWLAPARPLGRDFLRLSGAFAAAKAAAQLADAKALTAAAVPAQLGAKLTLGDGALLAEFSDGTRTTSAWKSYVVTFGPTDASISSGCSSSNLSPCAIQDNGVPSDWYATDFDDSSWTSATEYTASQAGWGRRPTYSGGQCGTITSPITKQTASPSSIATTADECLDPRAVLCGGDETCDGSDGRFIWGADMDRDNKMLFRFNASDTSSTGDSSDSSISTSFANSALLSVTISIGAVQFFA
eukprot:Skav232015  [mRNA]  locus=scaffold3320:62406:66626:- [translate_table: standard]